ncbi:hypothetical protein F4781DRAFT_386015 [Annulohypoxylon bovei var. microspora]|nr:hypothetical protein F4781DRAFT_386015 [Annulohypoxylon bovei var. microspora]
MLELGGFLFYIVLDGWITARSTQSSISPRSPGLNLSALLSFRFKRLQYDGQEMKHPDIVVSERQTSRIRLP